MTDEEYKKSVHLMLAYLCIATERKSSLERKVEILDKFGLSEPDIAIVCGSARQSIKNARYVSKKHGRKNKKAR